MRITYSVHTDIGERQINEDSFSSFHKGDTHCFVLCDGLGGHGMGDVASALVVDVFRDCFDKAADMKNFLDVAFPASQQILMTEQHERHAERKMKTTCVALVIDSKKALIGHIGDSRVYVFNKNRVQTRTLDHSIPQMLVLSGNISESEIRHHSERNIVLRVMGVEWEKPMYEKLSPIPIKKCQAFLLCSDGFWELIEEDEMCQLLEKARTVDEWLDSMIDIVRKNGIGTNMDNNTAIAVWCEK